MSDQNLQEQSHHDQQHVIYEQKNQIYRKIIQNPNEIQPEQKHFVDDINTIFAEDKNKFIGEFLVESLNYKIIRGYTNGYGDCLRLYYTKMEPLSNVKASICIVHGFGEYSGRFLDLGEYFAKNGFVVHLIDLRGFGYSGGPRGCSTTEQMHKDIEVLIKQANPNLPLFLYGHSMGGGLVLSLAQRNPDLNLAGVISTSGLIGFPKDRKMDFVKLNLVKLLGKPLEDVVANSMINITALTKNNYHIKKTFGDRLMIPFLGFNMAKSIIMMTEYLVPHAHQQVHPILMVHGKKDQVTNYLDSIRYYNNASSKVKQIKLFDNGYHELQHDDECEELKEVALEFCLSRLKEAKPLGILPSIRHGTPVQDLKLKRKLMILLLIVFYFILIKKLKAQNIPVLNSNLKLLFFPLFLLKKILNL